MKIGALQKILSIMLSLMFLGSGYLHLIVHSGGMCSCEKEHHSFYVQDGGTESATPQFFSTDSPRFVQEITVFCPICAGMLNVIFAEEASRTVQHFPEIAFCSPPACPVAFNDCQLPLSRGPPQS